MRRFLVFASLIGALAGAHPPVGPRFYPDDPLQEDFDRLDVPRKPEELDLSDLYDRFSHIFSDHGQPERGEAQNVNTLDEVPASSWFTNRHGRLRITLEELARGPDRGQGPDPNGPWTVFKSKSQGITPGFEIQDARGDRYIIKFDPVDVPNLASASEVIATKIFYALGYNTAENYIVRVDPKRFVIKPGTTVRDRFGDQVPLTPGRLRRLLRRVPRLPDGKMRVIASKYLPGVPLGPFRYYGTRSDDPNDVIPHEDRRELRGLRLFAAWTNHDDTRAQNTQDSWVEEGGTHHVRHYLLDFGSCFGSGSVEIQLPHLSFYYWLDLKAVKKAAGSFGAFTPVYHRAKWPAFPEYGAVGRWESELFDPESWRNDYPNPAFVRMTDRDAFWAAKILMRFKPEELRAIVKTGELGGEPLEEYFLKTLIERQRKCAAYLNRLNPLDEFRLDGGALAFTNLSELYGLGASGAEYRISWFAFNNLDRSRLPIKGPFTQKETRLELPVGSLPGQDDFLLAEIVTLHEKHPSWAKRIAVYLRAGGEGWEVVGIDRES
jgi:hypothetical protein